MSWPYEISWMNVPEKVRQWAEEVKQDSNRPNLWAELQRPAVSFQGVDGDVHREFGSGNALLRGVGGDVAGRDPVARRDAQRFAD